MEIRRHDRIKKDLKLLKRFPAPEKSLESWEMLLSLKGIDETPSIGKYQGLGNENIYKARVVPLSENFGKSKGYKLIFKMISDQECEILVFSRHGIYHDEKELIALIKERL